MITEPDLCVTAFTHVLTSLVNANQVEERKCDSLKKDYKGFVNDLEGAKVESFKNFKNIKQEK